MKLILGFDDHKVRQYVMRGSPAYFTIYWEHEGKYFPSEGWMDFGAVVLGWWIMCYRRLTNGGLSEDMLFMDGPFRLNVQIEPDGKTMTCVDPTNTFRGVSNLDDFAIELRRASNEVIRYLLDLNIDEKERTSLECGLKILIGKHAQE